jgi:hypothetical protein
MSLQMKYSFSIFLVSLALLSSGKSGDPHFLYNNLFAQLEEDKLIEFERLSKKIIV